VKTPCLDASLRQKLVGVFQEDVQKLRDFTGHPFSEWSI